MSKIVAAPLSRAKIKNYSEEIREKLGLSGKIYTPVVQIAENIIPIFDPTYNFRIAFDDELERNEYAKYNVSENELIIKEDVYIGAVNGDGRHRFTVSHELGHYFILTENPLAVARLDNDKHIPCYMDPEWQANEFASFFLMPPGLIYGMSAEEVSFRCGTSLQASEIAIEKAKRANFH